MLIFGVDPGFSGGLAGLQISEVDVKPVAVTAMPVKVHYTGKGREIDTAALIEFVDKTIRDAAQEKIVVFIERVGNMPRMRNGKKVVQGATSMFSFGDNFGCLRGALQAYSLKICKLDIRYVWPPTWQKAVFAKSAKGKSKQKALSLVKRLFPNLSLLATKRSKKPHEGLVDALAIAEYGRRQVVGET